MILLDWITSDNGLVATAEGIFEVNAQISACSYTINNGHESLIARFCELAKITTTITYLQQLL